MQSQYLPILLLIVLGGAFVGLLLGVSHLLGPHFKSPAKQMPYECGVPISGGVRHPFSVKFYLIALFFILFDIEIVFLFPWALIYRRVIDQAGVVILVDMAFFVAVLLIGLAYIWKKGALEWE
ncbi:MAG TPA: NADH-quinone oxidoreductase subunit A [Bdellovibrionota bacterium]|nr:NADH-quinone oxidoreductase subunit A [Bdellovibrionota bacterium]